MSAVHFSYSSNGKAETGTVILVPFAFGFKLCAELRNLIESWILENVTIIS